MHVSRLIAYSSAIQVRCATLLEHMHSDAALVCMLYRYDTRSHAGDALSAVPYFAGVMTEYVYISHVNQAACALFACVTKNECPTQRRVYVSWRSITRGVIVILWVLSFLA